MKNRQLDLEWHTFNSLEQDKCYDYLLVKEWFVKYCNNITASILNEKFDFFLSTDIKISISDTKNFLSLIWTKIIENWCLKNNFTYKIICTEFSEYRIIFNKINTLNGDLL